MASSSAKCTLKQYSAKAPEELEHTRQHMPTQLSLKFLVCVISLSCSLKMAAKKHVASPRNMNRFSRVVRFEVG